MKLGDKLYCNACMGHGEHPARLKCFTFKMVMVKCESCEGRGYGILDELGIRFNKAANAAIKVYEDSKAKAEKAPLN